MSYFKRWVFYIFLRFFPDETASEHKDISPKEKAGQSHSHPDPKPLGSTVFHGMWRGWHWNRYTRKYWAKVLGAELFHGTPSHPQRQTNIRTTMLANDRPTVLWGIHEVTFHKRTYTYIYIICQHSCRYDWLNLLLTLLKKTVKLNILFHGTFLHWPNTEMLYMELLYKIALFFNTLVYLSIDSFDPRYTGAIALSVCLPDRLIVCLCIFTGCIHRY